MMDNIAFLTHLNSTFSTRLQGLVGVFFLNTTAIFRQVPKRSFNNQFDN